MWELRDLVQILIGNDPYDMAADAVTVLDVWRKRARDILGSTTTNPRAGATPLCGTAEQVPATKPVDVPGSAAPGPNRRFESADRD
jgi:hypothetical protein